MLSKGVLSNGGNLIVEGWSFLRISVTLCCTFFSDTKCCESHLSQDFCSFEGKNVQKCEYPTELEAGSTVSASELFLPSCRSEISSGSFPFSSLAAEGSCWHPGDGNAPLCTCAFAGLGNAGQARLGKESCSSMVQLACLGRASQGIN